MGEESIFPQMLCYAVMYTLSDPPMYTSGYFHYYVHLEVKVVYLQKYIYLVTVFNVDGQPCSAVITVKDFQKELVL